MVPLDFELLMDSFLTIERNRLKGSKGTTKVQFLNADILSLLPPPTLNNLIIYERTTARLSMVR